MKGDGIRRTISISNTRKITASKKNRVEKGSRALFFGSKPHSKGDLFSRSLKLRALRVYAKVITTHARIIAIEEIIINILISNRTNGSIFGLKGQCYCKLLFVDFGDKITYLTSSKLSVHTGAKSKGHYHRNHY